MNAWDPGNMATNTEEAKEFPSLMAGGRLRVLALQKATAGKQKTLGRGQGAMSGKEILNQKIIWYIPKYWELT